LINCETTDLQYSLAQSSLDRQSLEVLGVWVVEVLCVWIVEILGVWIVVKREI